MRNFFLVVVTFVIAVIGISAISWPLYAALSLEQWLEFSKFTKWLALLVVAIATVGVLKSRGQLHWSMVGFSTPQKPPLYLLGAGIAVGLATLGPLGATLYLLDIRVIDTDAFILANISTLILSIIPAAIAISLIEETYFRGVQYGALIHERRVLAAIVLPAIFYASVHFINPPEVAIYNPDWFYGVTLLLSAPAEICRTSDCAGTTMTLFLAGALLGLVRALGGHLIVCIGIHTGWIVCIKLTKKLTDFDRSSDLAFLANGNDHFTGILAAIWVAILCAWLINRLVKNS